MVRTLLVLVAAMGAVAPAVRAEGVTVCVFQARKGHKVPDGSDAQAVADALNELKLPSGDSITAIPIHGVSVKEEQAEAQKRGCGFVAEVWQNDVGASTPLVGAAGANPASQDPGFNPAGSESSGSTVLEFSLRKADSDKKIAHGESDKSAPWSAVAGTMAGRIARAD